MSAPQFPPALRDLQRLGLVAWRWVQRVALALAVLLHNGPAAAEPATEAQEWELAKLRAQIADQVQLSAYDLLDELVYQWSQAPPFTTPTPVFIADVSVPVGLGTGLQALLENHLANLLLANPTTHVTLSHCPACTAVVVHSGKSGTVISRGLDNPEALAKVGGAGGRHGLYIDISAEGAWLVLRARITQLTPDLPVVWSRTLTTTAGTPPLLRSPAELKSAEDARAEYLDALQGTGPLTFLTTFAMRSYEGNPFRAIPPPILWLQTGLELDLTQARAWKGSFVLGGAWLPDAYIGMMAQARVSRLISGQARSLTHPNLYLFLGGAIMTLDGPAMAAFRVENAEQLLRDAQGNTSTRASFGALHLGLEARVGNRIGAAVFLENMPYYQNSGELGAVLDLGIELHSLGFEVSLCF